jgi:hypothetical protein
MTRAAFSSTEIAFALVMAGAMEVGFFGLLVLAGENSMKLKAEAPPAPSELPIAVKPVLDELPLLKLGGKKVKPKLPEMWKKQPPVQRFEERSAPSALAEKTVEAIPKSPLATADAAAPPPDAAVAREVDEQVVDAGPDAAPTVEGEGAADGVKEGTETDPLKAYVRGQYLTKVLTWFQSRFRPPTGAEVPCEELRKLRSAVTATLGPDHVTVTGYTVQPSGNAVFDARVKTTMDNIVGQQIPPFPPERPELAQTVVKPILSGEKAQCD